MKQIVLSQSKTRESNFELLRLVCMFYIVLHHFIVHGLKLEYVNIEGGGGVWLVMNAFFVIAVNCFILISGYFSIKTQWKGFFHLYGMCAFYGILFLIISTIYGDDINMKRIIYSFLPFSQSGLWFIRCYFYLILLSPMLNKIVDFCKKKEYVRLLLFWSILTFYCGFLWRGDVNNQGYNVMNFMFLYLIGRFIAIYTENVITTKRRTIYLCIYLLCSAIIGILGISIIRLNISCNWLFIYIYPYNSPLVIISSIAFVMFFRSIKIQNKRINWCAQSILAVYLIHENGFVGSKLYPYINKLGQHCANEYVLIIYFAFLAMLIMVVGILTDKIRQVVTNPIEKSINRINWDAYTQKSIDKLMIFIDRLC
jgi:surface polysaccharide O-acyltransferase-like enzyme